MPFPLEKILRPDVEAEEEAEAEAEAEAGEDA